jgi:hypothetical protein
MKNKNKNSKFESIIEEATIDCYSESEQFCGWFCVLEENISVPCKCFVGKNKKEQAILEKIEQDEHSGSTLGLIKLDKIKVRTPIENIILEDCNGMVFINAFKHWSENGE